MEHAIQVHPHDVRDEGPEVVVNNVVDRAGIHTIIAEAMTLEERHPYPKGQLPHNPHHQVVVTSATLEVPLEPGEFQGLPIRPRPSEAVEKGDDYIAALRMAAARRHAEIIPWVKALNGAFDGDIHDVCVRTVFGDPVPTWLCPTRPETAEYVFRLVRAISQRYPARAVLLDRLRYPDWSGATVSPDRTLTCFCDSCRRAMAREGIDVPLLEDTLKGFAQRVRARRCDTDEHVGPERRPLTPPADSPSASFAPLDETTSRCFGGSWLDELQGRAGTVIRQWIAFRQSAITSLAQKVVERFKKSLRDDCQQTAFWLNLWPPSFAWLLGQDYSALGTLCDGAKHFPYHRLGGGADLAGLVTALAGDRRETQEAVFGLLLGVMGIPFRESFQHFTEAGFPVEFVGYETAKAKRAFKRSDTPVFTGIQIWDIPEAEIASACRAAVAGGANGLFFYCYGWATLDALDRVGRVVQGLP